MIIKVPLRRKELRISRKGRKLEKEKGIKRPTLNLVGLQMQKLVCFMEASPRHGMKFSHAHGEATFNCSLLIMEAWRQFCCIELLCMLVGRMKYFIRVNWYETNCKSYLQYKVKIYTSYNHPWRLCYRPIIIYCLRPRL